MNKTFLLTKTRYSNTYFGHILSWYNLETYGWEGWKPKQGLDKIDSDIFICKYKTDKIKVRQF